MLGVLLIRRSAELSTVTVLVLLPVTGSASAAETMPVFGIAPLPVTLATRVMTGRAAPGSPAQVPG
jgi:hypothetical protein